MLYSLLLLTFVFSVVFVPLKIYFRIIDAQRGHYVIFLFHSWDT